MKEPRILASLRSADLDRLDEELRSLERAGIDGLHLDVMDGKLVEESCFPPEFVADLRQRTVLSIDVHLIAEQPEQLLRAYASAGAQRISFHLEAAARPAEIVEELHGLGVVPGLVVFPGTPLSELEAFLPSIGLVNPLGVDPRHGLGFQESSYARIGELCAMRDAKGLSFVVQADGGVWEKTRDGLVEAGADELVGGYPIFSSDDYAAAIDELRSGK